VTAAAVALGTCLGLALAAFLVVLWGTAKSRRTSAEAAFLGMIAVLLAYVYLPIGWVPTPARLGRWLGLIEDPRNSPVYVGYMVLTLAVGAAGVAAGRLFGLVSRVTRLFSRQANG
jgi:membrane-bound metal-dependent hydrolase YbcI (DUF457 family)